MHITGRLEASLPRHGLVFALGMLQPKRHIVKVGKARVGCAFLSNRQRGRIDYAAVNYRDEARDSCMTSRGQVVVSGRLGRRCMSAMRLGLSRYSTMCLITVGVRRHVTRMSTKLRSLDIARPSAKSDSACCWLYIRLYISKSIARQLPGVWGF